MHQKQKTWVHLPIWIQCGSVHRKQGVKRHFACQDLVKGGYVCPQKQGFLGKQGDLLFVCI